MSWLAEMLHHDFVRRALLGGALAGFLCGYVGGWVVLRRMALTTEALSHAMFPGLAVAAALVGLSPLGMLAGGVLAALLVAGGAEFITRSSRQKPDAALGTLYTSAYAVGLTVLAASGTRAHIEHWLFGDIFALGNQDLWQLWTVALVVVPLLVAQERPLALAVVGEDVARSMGIRVTALRFLVVACVVFAALASFHAGGVVPVVALLVAPAATMRLLTDRLGVTLWGGAALGTAGALGGVLLSYALNDVSGGACIALVLGSVFLATFVFAPQYGILARRRRDDHLLCEESFQRWHRPLRPGHAAFPAKVEVEQGLQESGCAMESQSLPSLHQSNTKTKHIMKKLALIALLAFTGSFARAEDKKLEGTATCAKCDLKTAEKCRAAVVVTVDGKTEVYLSEPNDKAKELHAEICKAGKPATVEGTVSEKDGVKTIKITKFELK